MPFVKREGASIYYEEFGSGFPILLMGPGGLDSSIDTWPRAAIDPLVALPEHFRLIGIDQRNAGRSRGALDTLHPWDSFAADQLAVADHLGIDAFHVFGCCIGCSFALKLIELAPNRVVSAVLEQPNGLTEENRQSQLDYHRRWADRLLEVQPDLDPATVTEFLRVIWNADFVVSVTRKIVSSFSTPMLVLPGIDLGHPTALGREIGWLAKNAEVFEPWKDTEADVVRATAKVLQFLESVTPA